MPFYVVMALPFTYRAIDAGIKAIDVRTLVDASRSLGAGGATTFRRALLPNLRDSHHLGLVPHRDRRARRVHDRRHAAKKTFPTFSFEYFGRDPQGGVRAWRC